MAKREASRRLQFVPRVVLSRFRCNIGASLLPMIALLAACNSGPVRDLRGTADTRQLSDAQQRRWHEAAQIDRSLRNKGLLLEDAETQAYVQSIMDRLFPEFRGTLHVHIARSSALNAFALPNGSIYINLGLLARMRNEAQLAMVLGHEATHFIEQHSLRQRENIDTLAVAGIATTVLTGIPFSGQLLMLGAMSGYSQDLERAADQGGFRRLTEAGYDPHQAPEVFRLMREEVDALDIDQPFLYSSHPRLSERIETLNRLAEPVTDGGEIGESAFARHIARLRGLLLAQYLDEADYKRLILILEDPQRRSDYPPEADFHLGEAYRLRGEDGYEKKALAAWQRCLEKAPDFAPVHRALGLHAMRNQQPAKAIIHLRRYLALAPQARDRAYIRSYLERLEGKKP